MSKETMKLALEALQKIYIAPEHEDYIKVWWPACEQAITALKKLAEQPAQRKPPSGWVAVSDRIPLESDGEVLVRMRDGRCEIAWATYWHGASNAFAQWTFRDPDEDEAPTHWMHIPTIEAAHGITKGNT